MPSKPLSLRGKKILLTAGPTREYWDPVRFFTNSSTGAMGIALAEEASRRGARVTVVLGPIAPCRQSEISRRIRIVPVVSAWEMYEAVKKNLPGTDLFVGTAAVVDYRPAVLLSQKIKHHSPTLTLRLHGNPDIVAMVGHHPSRRPRLVIGFALETDHLIENARGKLLRKKLDWIVANRESAMAQEKSEAVLLSRWGHVLPLSRAKKKALAKKIWDRVL